jgi:hypothetical protein
MAQTMPDPGLTPGDIGDDTDPAVICQPGYSARHRIYNTQGRAAYEAMIATVMQMYHIPVSQKHNYEFDDRVEISVGGKQSVANVWPQPCSTWIHNQYGSHCVAGEAADKDQCEFRVHRQVCYTHELSPVEAQAIFLGDWRPYCFGRNK